MSVFWLAAEEDLRDEWSDEMLSEEREEEGVVLMDRLDLDREERLDAFDTTERPPPPPRRLACAVCLHWRVLVLLFAALGRFFSSWLTVVEVRVDSMSIREASFTKSFTFMSP